MLDRIRIVSLLPAEEPVLPPRPPAGETGTDGTMIHPPWIYHHTEHHRPPEEAETENRQDVWMMTEWILTCQRPLQPAEEDTLRIAVTTMAAVGGQTILLIPEAIQQTVEQLTSRSNQPVMDVMLAHLSRRHMLRILGMPLQVISRAMTVRHQVT